MTMKVTIALLISWFLLIGCSPKGQDENINKVVAIYFGYTQCPDVCPTDQALLGNALKKLTKKELDKIQGIFISVDPGRDTPELLADILSSSTLKLLALVEHLT